MRKAQQAGMLGPSGYEAERFSAISKDLILLDIEWETEKSCGP